MNIGSGEDMTRSKRSQVVRLQDYHEGKEREQALKQAALKLQKIREAMENSYRRYAEHLDLMDIELADYEEEDRLLLVGEQTLEHNPVVNISFMVQFNLELPVIDLHLIFTPEGTLKRRQKIYTVINAWNQEHRFVSFFLDSDQDLVVRMSLDVENHFDPKKLDEALIRLTDLATECYDEVKGFWAE